MKIAEIKDKLNAKAKNKIIQFAKQTGNSINPPPSRSEVVRTIATPVESEKKPKLDIASLLETLIGKMNALENKLSLVEDELQNAKQIMNDHNKE